MTRECSHRRVRLATAAIALLLATTSGAWTLELRAEVAVVGGTVTLADVSATPPPEGCAAITVLAGGRPGASASVSRRTVLRKLVLAGSARDVTLVGADRCRIRFTGVGVATTALTERVRALLQPHLPVAMEGAPPTWVVLDVPDANLSAVGEWSVSWPEPRALTAGRNLLNVAFVTGQHKRRLSVTATVHAYALAPQAVTALDRGQTANDGSLRWIWTDLAEAKAGTVTDPAALADAVLVRDIAPGTSLTGQHLAPRPLVRRGELVDLVVRRGSIAAVVRAECRQDGTLGQVVTVLNPLTRRPVVAHVAAAGVVTMGR